MHRGYRASQLAVDRDRPVRGIEDLHWADEGTCELLVFFAREIDRLPVHIVCTYRNTDVRRLSPIAKTVGTVLALPRAHHIRLTGLSVKEIRVLDVLREVAIGKTDAEIAETLFISTKTASNHVGNILKKTGAANRTEATRFAVDHGLIDANESPGD